MGLLFLLTMGLCLLASEASVCQTHYKAGLSQYNGRASLKVRMPCKFIATNVNCQGYKVRVSPGQAYDSKKFLFTDTVYVSIFKEGTDYYWKGRTSTKYVSRYFNNLDSMTPFSSMEQNLDGAPFSVQMSAEASNQTVYLSVSDADFKIIFDRYAEGDIHERKMNSGIRIICPELDFSHPRSHYPHTLCGTEEDVNWVLLHKKALGLGSTSQTLIYDILYAENITQTTAECQTATAVFRSCPWQNRIQALKVCSPLLTSQSHLDCNSGPTDIGPMEVFIVCLQFRCNTHLATKCQMLKEYLEGCPDLPGALPADGTCPVMEGDTL